MHAFLVDLEDSLNSICSRRAMPTSISLVNILDASEVPSRRRLPIARLARCLSGEPLMTRDDYSSPSRRSPSDAGAVPVGTVCLLSVPIDSPIYSCALRNLIGRGRLSWDFYKKGQRMRILIAAAATLTLLTGFSFAQTAPQTSTTPSVSSPTATNPKAPVPGANSFTEGQAKSRIESNGFSNVSALQKDAEGVWRGKAMKNGASVSVGLDFQGNVVSN
jgi:hypothetical protein